MKKYIAETLGTFVLVFGGCGTAVLAGGNVGFLGVSFAFGLTVVAMAYGIGHISGAHLNPAVSIGALCAGKLKAKDFGGYVVAQIIGGILAAVFLAFLVKSYGAALGTFAANGFGADFFGDGDVESGYKQISTGGAFAIEFVLTFVFIIVILGATSPKAPAGFGGLAIGLTLVLIHLISIPLTNTSVNPARSIGPALFSDNAFALKQLWLFIVAPLAGGACGGLFWSRMCACKNGVCAVD